MALINSRMGSTPEKPPAGWCWCGAGHVIKMRRGAKWSTRLSSVARCGPGTRSSDGAQGEIGYQCILGVNVHTNCLQINQTKLNFHLYKRVHQLS